MNKEDMNLQEHKERSMKGFKRRKEMGESYNYSEISKNNRNKKKLLLRRKESFGFHKEMYFPPPFSLFGEVFFCCVILFHLKEGLTM